MQRLKILYQYKHVKKAKAYLAKWTAGSIPIHPWLSTKDRTEDQKNQQEDSRTLAENTKQ